MKLIVVGCEYAGKSTLIREIVKWQRTLYNHVNVHDHFTFPAHGSIGGHDEWDPADQEMLLKMTPAGKARVTYWGHIFHVGNMPAWGMLYGDAVYEGYYIEDIIYGKLYYGYGDAMAPPTEIPAGDTTEFARYLAVKPGMRHMPNLHGSSTQQHFFESMILNADPNTILMLIEASPEVIARRMRESPHQPQRIKEEDIDKLLEMFRQRFLQSILANRMVLDTSEATIEETFEQFKRDVTHFLTEKDMLRMVLHSLRTGERP